MKPIRGGAKTKFLRWRLLYLVLGLANCVQAQTITILHDFSAFGAPSAPEGGTPAASLVLSNNTLFGTTEFGANGYGTVFAINTDGSGYTNLHAFTPLVPLPASANQDGANPGASLIESGNLLYGTTENGGADGEGTIFVATLDGAEVKTLYSFTNGNDGANPGSALILSGATLYGTARSGGSAYSGTIFAINTDGSGFRNVYTFTNGTDGADPAGGLVLSGNTLYGTAETGGDNSSGTIFSINTNGSGFASLHGFDGDDGDSPMATLTLSGATLYGTTLYGGASFSGGLFAINTDGSGFTNFYSFTGLNDGSAPAASLTFSNNVLYGTASGGGKGGSGTVFAVDTNGANFTNLYSFTGGADGMTPECSLFLTNNVLYGTTEFGGVFSNGTVFAVATAGIGFTNLYSFTGVDDGGNPVAGLVGDTLYGTTLNGGNAGDGVLFAIQTDGSGFTNLHSFVPPSLEASGTNTDGAYPTASLLLSGGILYGTTQYGGDWGNGTIFTVNADGSGFTNIYTFTAGADGANPAANLVLSGDTLYGTTDEGGSGDNGTVFSLRTDGSDFTVLYRFTGEDDGGYPAAGLAVSGDTLYGTTETGGLFYGTVFAINTDGTGFKTLYSFTGGADGGEPQAPLTLSGNTLYGTAETGGTNGWGTVFSIQVNGSNFMLLHDFTGEPQGGNPYGSLLLLSNTLYGTTYAGGVSNFGTVFAIQTDGLGFTTLYSLTNANDGAYPAAGLALSGDSTLYGTAEDGGSAGSGAIFSIQTDGADYTDVHSFVPYSTSGGSINSDGAFPLAGLLASEGTLYGTAYAGGSAGAGTVFSLLTNGSNFITLHNFTNGMDGAYPQASLTRLSNTLFSTAVNGGMFGMGTVFAIETNGMGFVSMHSFAGGNDGAYPTGSLLLWSNVLYGTTSGGGLSNKGTIFAINPDGSGYATLYSFTGGSDGATPLASLAVWSNSWLLCTASAGGSTGLGTLFALKVTPLPTKLSDPDTFSYSLTGGSQGDNPYGTPNIAPGGGDSSSWGGGGSSTSWGGGGSCGGGLRARLDDGLIHITTGGRGVAGDYGTVQSFLFNPSAGGFSAVTSVPFTDLDGAGPDGNLFNWKGYGWLTTESGGPSGYGCISAYSYSSQTLQLLYNFPGGNLGNVPTGDLTGFGDYLYGPAAYGGIGEHGVIYSALPCSGSQDFSPPVINGAIYNSSTGSLYLNYTGSLPNSSPQDPTTRISATVYNTSGTPSPLDSFDFSTPGGGAFTYGHSFRVGPMPMTVALSFSSLCGESALSTPATVSEAPGISYAPLSGNRLSLSWPSSPFVYGLQSSPDIGRGAVWTDVTSPAPVLSGSQYSVTVTPGSENTFFRLRYSF